MKNKNFKKDKISEKEINKNISIVNLPDTLEENNNEDYKLEKIDKQNEENLSNSNTTLYNYIKKVSNLPFLTKNEEEKLLKDFKENSNKEAGKKIILSHLRLVVKIALEFKNYKANTMDTISEGNLGLMHALDKFDISKKVKFATYAIFWIKAFIQNFIIKSWSNLKNNSSQVKTALFSSNKNKEIIEQDFSFDAINTEDSKMEDYFSFNQLDKKDEFKEIIDEDEKERKYKQIMKIINENLNEREAFIIKARFIKDEKKETLDSLSKLFDISKERVRQIEKEALDKIKRHI